MRSALLIVATLLPATSGHEVYVSELVIFQTHDTYLDPTIVFRCPDDDRPGLYFPDVISPHKVYTYPPEAKPATHVDTGGCRNDCALYDEDLFSKDDRFGDVFSICESAFVDGEYQIRTEGEFRMVLRCSDCNLPPPPPPVSHLEIFSSSTIDHEEDISVVHGKGFSFKPIGWILIAAVGLLVLGISGGMGGHILYRKMKDEAAEEERRRFYALYAGENGDIEELPDLEPVRTGMTLIAHNLRQWYQRQFGYMPQASTPVYTGRFQGQNNPGNAELGP